MVRSNFQDHINLSQITVMKHICSVFFALLIVVVFCSKGDAQDRVVMISGDTLKCSIYKENNNFLYFKQYSGGVYIKGKIAKNEVAEWTYRAGSAVEVPVEAQKPSDLTKQIAPAKKGVKEPIETEKGNLFRANMNIGSGLMVGDTEDAIQNLIDLGVPKVDAENYADNLIVGSTAKITLYYQFLKNYWLGAFYNGFYSDAKMLTRVDYDSNNWYYGEMGEKNFINFVGPSFYTSTLFGRKKRYSIHTGYTIGPVFYRNESEAMRHQTLLTAVTLGQNLDLGLEYFIKPRLSILFDVSLFSSRLGKMTIETVGRKETVDLDKDDNNNLSRFDLSAGLVFYW
jgi:hypothetical protein